MVCAWGKIALLPAGLLLWPGAAHAGQAVLVLKALTEVNIDDSKNSFGGWLHEGGTIAKSNVAVGHFINAIRQSSTGPKPVNAGAATITLMLASQSGPASAFESVTIEGVHDFNSGAFKGSVSAASSPYDWVKGASASYTTQSLGSGKDSQRLVIQWVGNNKSTLP